MLVGNDDGGDGDEDEDDDDGDNEDDDGGGDGDDEDDDDGGGDSDSRLWAIFCLGCRQPRYQTRPDYSTTAVFYSLLLMLRRIVK